MENIDYATRAALLSAALKRAREEEATPMPEARTLGGYAVGPTGGEIMNMGLRQALGGYSAGQREQELTALNDEQMAKFNDIAKQLTTPGTKVLKRTLNALPADQEGPTGPEVEEQVPLDYSNPADLAADNARRMGLASQMSTLALPQAQKVAQDYLSKGAAFPDTLAQLQMKQIEAGEQNARRLEEKEKFDRLYKMTADQQFNLGKQKADAATTAANLKTNAANLDPDAVDDLALRLIGGEPVRNLGIPAAALPVVQARAAEMRRESGMTPDQTGSAGTNYKERADSISYFTRGKGSERLAGFNTLAGHMDTMEKLGDALKSNDLPAVNRVVQFVQKQSGDPTVTSFDVAKNFVAKEMGRALLQVGGGVTEREKMEALFQSAASPEQLKAAIATAKELVKGQFATLESQYKKTGRSSDYFRSKELVPAAQALIGYDPSKSASSGGEAGRVEIVLDGVKYISFDGGKTWNK